MTTRLEPGPLDPQGHSKYGKSRLPGSKKWISGSRRTDFHAAKITWPRFGQSWKRTLLDGRSGASREPATSKYGVVAMGWIGRPGPRGPGTQSPTPEKEKPRNSSWASKIIPRQRPTLPRGLPRSTIGAEGLNGRVRNGNGCGPFAKVTGKLCFQSLPSIAGLERALRDPVSWGFGGPQGSPPR
jgi:hypothetical protein